MGNQINRTSGLNRGKRSFLGQRLNVLYDREYCFKVESRITNLICKPNSFPAYKELHLCRVRDGVAVDGHLNPCLERHYNPPEVASQLWQKGLNVTRESTNLSELGRVRPRGIGLSSIAREPSQRYKAGSLKF